MPPQGAAQNKGGRPANFGSDEYDYETIDGKTRATPPVHRCTKCAVPDPATTGEFKRGIPYHSTYLKATANRRVRYVTPACIICEREAAKTRKRCSQDRASKVVKKQVQHGKTAPAHLAHHIKDTVPGEAKSPQTLQKPVMYPLVAADPPFTAPAAAPKQRLVQPRVPISPAAHPPWEVVPLYSPRLVGAAHEHAVGPAPMTLQLSPDQQQQQQQQAIDIQAELVTEVTATTPDTESLGLEDERHAAMMPSPASRPHRDNGGMWQGLRDPKPYQPNVPENAPCHKMDIKPKMQLKPGQEHSLLVGPGHQARIPKMRARPKSLSPWERAFVVACISKPGAYCSGDCPARIVTTPQGMYEVQLAGQPAMSLGDHHAMALGLTKMGLADAQGWSPELVGRFAAGPPWAPDDNEDQPEGYHEAVQARAFPGLGDRLVSFFYNCCRIQWDKATRTRAKRWLA